MSMSTNVIGIKPQDKEWDKMKNAYNACKAAGIKVPQEVLDFFDHNDPNKIDGLEIDLDDHEAVEEYFDDHRSGYSIRVDKLPKDLKVIRVVNSW